MLVSQNLTQTMFANLKTIQTNYVFVMNGLKHWYGHLKPKPIISHVLNVNVTANAEGLEVHRSLKSWVISMIIIQLWFMTAQCKNIQAPKKACNAAKQANA